MTPVVLDFVALHAAPHSLPAGALSRTERSIADAAPQRALPGTTRSRAPDQLLHHWLHRCAASRAQQRTDSTRILVAQQCCYSSRVTTAFGVAQPQETLARGVSQALLGQSVSP